MRKGTTTILIISVICAGCAGRGTAEIGVKNGRLAPCPDYPNCVSSQTTDRRHYIESIAYSGSLETARETTRTVIETMKRTKILTIENNYSHAEFTSALFRFVDDVEFYLAAADKTIHLRSASRKGYSDLGVNKKRMESIRIKFMALAGGKE